MKIIPAEKNTLEGLLHADVPDGPAADAFFRRIDTLQASYDKSIVLGGMHRIKYLDFQHDPLPLALILDYIPSLQAVLALNLHYLTRSQGLPLIKFLAKSNSIRVLGGKGPMLPVPLVERAPMTFKPYRLYKVDAIKPMFYLPFDQWADTMGSEINKWQGFRDFGDTRLQKPKNPNRQNKENKTRRSRNERPKKNKPNSGTNRR